MGLMNSKKKWKLNLKGFYPWPCFFLWAAVNALLAYSSLETGVKIGIGFLGLFVPFIGLLIAFPSSPRRVPPLDPWKSPPRLLWAGILLLLGFAVFLRLYRLVSLTVWPMWDDAACSFFSIQLLEHWRWQLFFTAEQCPPLHFWLQSLFFRIDPPSLSSLWLYPALFSMVTVPTAYWASRQFFSKPFSLLLTGLVAFSFWPWYEGRFHFSSIILWWEFLVAGLLGFFLKAEREEQRPARALALGLGAGLGLYIYVTWIPIFAVLAVGMAVWLGWRKPRDLKSLCFFLVPAVAVALPLAAGIFHNLIQGHVSRYLVFNNPDSSLQEQWRISISYLTALFWDVSEKSLSAFGPSWGGFLNPILGSAFFIGLLELARSTPKFWIRWLCFAGLIFLAPGLLSNTIELMRILPLLPLALLVVAWGIQGLLAGDPSVRGRWMVLGLAFFSFGLDFHHWTGPYHDRCVPGPSSVDSKSPERFRAFQILQQKQAAEGPGWILTEFLSNIFDQSLLSSTYSFNSARNPRLDPRQARWAAVLTNAHFSPYFASHFPRSQTYWLSAGLSRLDDGWILALIPLEDLARAKLQPWLEAHRSIQNLFGLMPYHTANPSYGPAQRALEENHSLFRKDPFLESCYLEKLANLNAHDEGTHSKFISLLQEGIHQCGVDPSLKLRSAYFWQKLADDYQTHDHKIGQTIAALQKAEQLGYQTVELYRRLARLHLEQKNYRKARQYVRLAWKLNPQNPPPREFLQWLDQMADPSTDTGKAALQNRKKPLK
jgi:hypothetical protein